MGSLAIQAEKVLLVTRRGAEGSGGAVGHDSSLDFYFDALGLARADIFTVNLPKGPFFIRKFKTYIGLKDGYLSGVNKSAIYKFRQKLRELNPKIVIFDSSLFGPLVVEARNVGCVTITQLQNCEFDFYSGDSALRGGWGAKVHKAAYIAESQSIASSSIVLALSEYDKNRINRLYGASTTILVVNPLLGRLIDGLKNYIKYREAKPREVGQFLFIGSDTSQNRLASDWLINRWTKKKGILTIAGNVGNYLLGKKEAKEYLERGIKVLGFATDLRKLFNDSTALLCPMWLGSGVKVKIIDSLAHGCPVFGTLEAFVGFEFAVDTGMLYMLNDNVLDNLMSSIPSQGGDINLLLKTAETTISLQRQNFVDTLKPMLS